MEGAGDPNEILPWLFLGDMKHGICIVSTYSHLKVSRVLNVGGGSMPNAQYLAALKKHHATESGYLMKPISDYGDTDLKSSKDVKKALNFIIDSKHKSGRCLVHCRQGVNRSPTMVLLFLLLEEKFPLQQALHHVQQRRPCSRPHPHYWEQLVALEKDMMDPSIPTADMHLTLSHQNDKKEEDSDEK